MTPDMIRMFLKIIKFFLGLIGVFCLFVLFMVTAFTSVPYFTSKHYKNNETPSSLFYVVLESFDPHLNQSLFQCFRWKDFKEVFQATKDSNVYVCREANTCFGYSLVPEREYTTYLSVSGASCSNISSEFKVQNLDATSQVIRLRWAQEAFKVRNCYRVTDNTVIPLHFKKLMSAGIAVSIFLAMIIVVPMIIIFLRFCYKKYGKMIFAGLAFIMAGLSAFNLALFDRRMSLDPLTESPEFFISKMKILFSASGILFICAAILFWINKKKRLIPSDKF